MKKFLRTLCVGLVAMCVASASFAQTENVTSKLVNADMEKGVRGWNFESARRAWTKNTKDQATQRGYHGMNNTVLEYWKNTASGLPDNTISQTVDSLPNGTYVFGAYVGASVQWVAEPNRETVYGVTMFANESSVAVATNDPSYSAAKWAHTAKFNVATTVSDGTLTVGLKAEDTNANFLIMDNATLYYFGDMDEAAALDEMAKIDMAATVAIADTCLAYHMNVDSLALITEAKAAAEAVATADAAWQADEDLYWAIFKANRSIADYRSFSNAIAAANVVAAGEWTDYVGGELESLHSYIDEAEDLYEAATMNREEIEAKVSMLNEAAALVTLDSCYVMIDMCYEALDEGEYSEDVYIEVENLLEDVGYALERVYEGFSAIEVKKECDLLFAQIQELLDNPNSLYDEFPILMERDSETLFNTSHGTFTYLKGTEVNDEGLLTYQSKLYRFQEPLHIVRFIIKETGFNQFIGAGPHPMFCLSSFEMYDEYGDKIDLEETMVTSNAEHNALNPDTNDGQGIPALFDDDSYTYFHSTWINAIDEYHHLEVALPEGEFTAFSFVMTARHNNNHQFPATIEIVAPSVVVEDILRPVVNEAKEMNPYRGTDPGFYNVDLTAFQTALANAEALLGGNASDDAVIAAAEALADEIDLLQSCMVMPEPSKQYHIVSAAPFFENQGVHKAWTAYSDFDQGLVNHVWWETARPDSPEQLFTFEAIPDEEGKYYVKNVSTGLYVGTPYTDYGDVLNAVALFKEADAVELQPLGYGQFGLFNNGMIHAGSHNNGVYSEDAGPYGGIRGVYSSLVKWNEHSAYKPSAWYIREMSELPLEIQVDNTIPYRSATINLYSGVNEMTLTADKDCAFDDLIVYDLLGNELGAYVSVQGNTALVQLENNVASFSFAFNNYEGVATLTIGGGISKLSELREAYDAAVAIAPVEGKDIMQYPDLDEYEAALAYANGLLTDGGTDEEMMTAIAMIEDAVANLQPNLPLPDHTYYIVNALPGFYEYHGVNMMMYADEWEPKWTYENTQELNRRWLFEPADGEGYYLKNVATEMYLGYSESYSYIYMVYSKEETVPYVISSLSGDTVAIAAITNENARLHAMNNQGGANDAEGIGYWPLGIGSASAWRISDTKLYGMEELYAMSVKNVSANSPALITIPIELENTGEVTAFQFDLCLPDGFTIVQNEGGYDISFNSERVTANHKLTVEPQADGVLRITGSSTSNEVFLGEESAIVNVNVAVDRSVLKGNYAVALRNICITKSDATEVIAEDDTATLSIKESLVELLETLQAAKDTFTAGLLELDSLGLGDATDRLNQHYNEVNDTIDENSIESVKTKIQSIKQLTKECEAELAAYYCLQEQLAKLQTTRAAFAECIANLEELNLIGMRDALKQKYEEVSDVDEGSIEAVMAEILRIEQLLDEYASGMNAYQRLAKLIADCEGYALQFPIEEFIAAIDAAKTVIENSMSTTENFVEAYDALYDMCTTYVGLVRIHLDNPGTLYNKILEEAGSFDVVERLEVSGALNDDDLWCIQNYMTMLKEIDMAAAEVTHLRNRQFEYHYWLKSVTLPATLTTIGYDIFAGCDSLESVISTALIPPYVDGMSFGMNVTNGLTKLYVPEWTINWYKLDDAWDDFAVIKPIEGYWPEHIGIAQDLTLTLPETLPIAYKPSLSIDWSDALNRQSSLTIDGNASLALKEFGMGYDVEWEARCNGEYITHATLINHTEVTADSISMWVEITNDQWSFLSFPFDVKVADIMPTQPNTSYAIRKYSGKDRAEQNFGNTWQDMTVDSVLHAGEGYIWQSRSYDNYGYWQETSAFIISAADTDNKNNIFAHTDCVVALNEYIAESADDCSWNLIGNPYPSYYDTREMDFTAPITVWNMHYNSYYAYSPIDDEYILRPGEAFFVQCPTGTEAITFRADGRQADRVVRERATQAKAYARNADERQVFNLTLSNGEMDDRTRIVINPAAACDYEMNCDASKFMSSDARVPQLYTVNNGMKLAINERPLSDGVVSLGAYFGSKGSYTIALDTKVEGMSVVLVDKVTGMETDLMNTTYTFTAEAGAVDNRFAICLRAGEEGDATGCDALSGQVSVKAAGRQIVVTAPSVSPIEVYNADGHRIATATATSAVVDVEPGVYVVKVQAYVHKVVIK